MTRREAAEKVFDYMRKNSFEPINIQYGDGYFVFDMGEDGVVHFNIANLHGWKFAMWIETDPETLKREDLKDENGNDYPAIQFFCQHELNIDKFKPSRCFFCVNFSLENLEYANNGNDRIFYEVEDILQLIRRHPFVAFSMDAYDNKCYDKSYIMCYLRMKYRKTKEKFKEWVKDTSIKVWHGSKLWFINKCKVVDKAGLIDNNGDGWKCYPRYAMYIHFKKISDDEEIQENAEIKMLNFWFHKYNYKNMRFTLTREGVDGEIWICKSRG